MSLENNLNSLLVATEPNVAGKMIKNEKLLLESLTENTHVVGQQRNEQKTLIGNKNFIPNEEMYVVNGNDVEELHKKLNTICRFCLVEEDNLRTIFDEYNCISDMFFVFASIQFSQNDGLPEQICCDCLTQLTKCVNFKQQVETAEAVLKHFIEEGYKTGMTLEKLEAHNLEKYAEIHANQFSLEFISDNNDEFTTQDFNDTEYYEDYNMDDPQAFPIIQTKLLIAEIPPHIEESEDNLQNELILNITNNTNDKQTNDDELLLPDNTPEKSINELYENQSLLNLSDETNNVTFEISNLNAAINNGTDENKSLNCIKCNKSFKTNSSLKRHSATHCKNITKINANNSSSLVKDEESTEASFRCEICLSSFNYKEDLYVHGSIHIARKTNDGELKCRKCNKTFTSVPKLKRHVRIHFEDKPYKCENCGRGFPEMCSLKRHFRKNHSNKKKEKKYVCKFCDKKYYESYALMVHTRTHTAEKPHKCDTCDKAFTDIRLLNSHRKTHLGLKTYVCKHCDRKFTHQSTLTTHLRTHTGEKPYVCMICNKYFIQSSNLTLHMRIHSGEKPYNCDICSKAFASSSALTIHKRTHKINDKSFTCPHCEKLFNRSDVASHLLTHSIDEFTKNTDQSFSTTNHVKAAHIKKQSFLCEICNKICINANSLKKHLKIHEQTTNSKSNEEEIDNTTSSITIEHENIYDDTNNSSYCIINNNSNDIIPDFVTNLIEEEDDDNDPELNESISLVNDLLAAVAESDLNSNII